MKKIKKFFKWIFLELKDWRTFLIFIAVCIVLGVEVWGFYIAGFVVGIETEAGKWCIGIASACLAFWTMPWFPFFPLCVAITLGIKKLIKKKKR